MTNILLNGAYVKMRRISQLFTSTLAGSRRMKHFSPFTICRFAIVMWPSNKNGNQSETILIVRHIII